MCGEQEQIEIPSIYFFAKRKVFLRDGMICPTPFVYQEENEEIVDIVCLGGT
jgi:hypothetical protein